MVTIWIISTSLTMCLSRQLQPRLDGDAAEAQPLAFGRGDPESDGREQWSVADRADRRSARRSDASRGGVSG